jgi:hypothetical protein
VETRRTVTGEPRTSLADVVPGARVAPVVRVVLAVWVALVVPVGPVVLAVWVALAVLESPAVRVVLVGLEDLAVPGVPENPVALVVLESPVVQELEIGPVAAELALVQVEVRLRTKSVIAARRHDQAPRLAAEEDLAAVVETTRDPAATEAGIAWAVAE